MTTDQLASFIRQRSNSEAVDDILNPAPKDEKTRDRERKAKQRAQGREVYIPVPVDYELRLACLADPELLLTTCFPKVYFEPFTEDRKDMLRSIWRAASYGGDQAIAGPRGEGKTTIAMDGALALMLAGLSTFPVVIGKNQDSASDELKFLRERMLESDEFAALFPEIAIPMRAVGPHAANARLQTVGGVFIRMHLGQKHFAFPTITDEMLPHWPEHMRSVAKGQVIGAVGIEGKIRGFKFRSERPTLSIIDDIESPESVLNHETIQKFETIIEEDIGGMGSSSEQIARVYLCTTLNRQCNAFKYTDRTKKRSWNGRRYRKMLKPPSRMDLVEQYIDLYKNRKDDDPDAREAYRFWKDNQQELEKDAVVSNKHSYSKKIHEDGEPMELSAVHAYYNVVARRGPKAAATELDNDPPEDASAKGIGLTVQVVSSRLNGLAKRQLPANTVTLTAAIDLGKYYCHWAVVAWWQGAGGCVVDYGAKQVLGTDNTQDHYAAEPHIFDALLDWREQILQTNYTDASGIVRKVDLCFVDSGAFTNCAYKFCVDVGRPFFPSKGIANYKKKKADTNRLFVGDNLHCEYLPAHKVALYELDTDYWKQFIHERFMTSTFDENNMLRRGALSLYHTEKKHTMYAEHICAEEYVSEFVEGKGSKQYWNKRRDDNHWLDATYMAAAAAEVYGVKLLSSSEAEIVARQTNPAAEKQAQVRRPQQHGQANRFRTRPGGWIPRRR
jgi:hypothetical protein